MPKEPKVATDTSFVLTGRYTTDYDVPGAHSLVLAALAATPDQAQAYAAEAQTYVDWYEQMRYHPPVQFGKTEHSPDPFAPHRVQLIRRYLTLARKYVPENVIYEPPKPSNCACGLPFSDFVHDITGILVCPACGTERPQIGRKKSSALSGDDAPTVRRSVDNDERDTFVKALIRYQGMQKDRLPSDLLARLDTYFCANNYPIGEQVRQGASHPALSKDVMYKALAAVGCPMYDHINLICHKVWGWPLPELHGLYDTILQHFDILQRVAQTHKIPTINTQYRLFKHLEMAGYVCYPSDFRIPKTREIIQADEDRWRAMCDGVDPHERALGIRFIPTL